MNTIESLLEMSLDKLIAMSDVEIETYLAEALKICPPVKYTSSVKSVSKTSLNLANKMSPQSPLAQQLAGMSPQKRQLVSLARQLGMNVDDLTGGKDIK